MRLLAAGARMREANSPHEFMETEREIHDLARELADEYTADVLREITRDEERTRAAATRLRESVAGRKLVLESRGRRETPVQLLGGRPRRFCTLLD